VVLSVLALSLLALGLPVAFAEQPLMNRLDLNETTTNDSLCNFPLVVQQEGTLQTSLFFDEQSGEVVRITENWHNVTTTITNPENGLSVTSRFAGHDGFTFDEDGGLKIYRQGVRGLITVPGVGATFGEAGNVTSVISPDRQVETRVSGFQWDGDFSAVCTYLAGTPQQP
jgi:hypothetical protein